MHSLRDPKWVFLVNTGPVLLLLALCAGGFSIVRTLLPPESVAQWRWFGLALVGLGLAAAGYAGLQTARRQPLGAGYGVAVLTVYSLLLCLFTANANAVLPRAVPRWMVPTDPMVMAWTFLMPTLAHALLALVARFTPDGRPRSWGTNLVLAAMVPPAWGLGCAALAWPLASALPSAGTAILVAGTVLATLLFFFFLVRGVYLIALRRAGRWAKTGLLWKCLLTIFLPLLGLAVNAGLVFGAGFGQQNGIFGDFSSPWFYVLAALNGALLCLPGPARPGLRLALLAGRSALFGYTCYFFLVFLPLLPLSIPAILLLGTGFLLLAPTLLFVLHLRQLSDDVAALRAVYSKAAVAAALGAGLAVLPLAITLSYGHSRRVLHEALAYVYTPDYSRRQPPVDAAVLARTLAVVKQHKDRGREFFYGAQMPYLSAYFNWVVLDNLMLSDGKIADLERVFSGPAGPPALGSSGAPAGGAGGPRLRGLAASSTYEAREQAWVSWVSLEIANPDSSVQDGEYSTRIGLPAGCWVSDYALTIGNRQERGILAEKNAATWVFAQILNEDRQRDPGLVSYRGPNDITVRVYPVAGGQVRRTRIQFLHKEPCTLTIDGQRVVLGNARTGPPVAAPVATPGSGVVYVSALAKKCLPLVQRRPYYHFLLDASASPGAPRQAYQERVARQLAQALPHSEPARFSLVNAYATPVAAGADWARELRQLPLAGGFYLSGALRRVLFHARQHPGPTCPVIVVVTDRLNQAVLDEDFEDFSSAYPESDLFYVLAADGTLTPHSLRHRSRQPLEPNSQVPGVAPPVRAWPNAAHPRAYLRDNELADIVLEHRPAGGPVAAAPASRWLAGLLLSGHGQWQSFHPETTDRERVPFIQASFRAGILTPFTAYLALENDAQKAALRRKQAQVLAANASLDTLEDDQTRPTEVPIDRGALLLAMAGALLGGWYLRRSTRVLS